MKKEHIPYYISALSLVISGIAIGVSFYRTEELDMDYMGVIVGILSLLVTALLGWNIYSLIDVRKIKDELTSVKINSLFNAERNNTITCHAMGDFYYRLVVGEKPFKDVHYLIYYKVSEIFHASNMADYKTCEILINALLEMCAYPESIEIKETNKVRTWELITRINGKENIPNYNKLVSLISRIGLNHNNSHAQKQQDTHSPLFQK